MFPLCTWALGSLLRSRAWSSANQGPLQPYGSWGSGREGRGSKSKGQTDRTGTPRGRRVESRNSHTCWDPPTLQQRRGRCSGEWRNGREHGQHFPCWLGHQRASWDPGPNTVPSEAPSSIAELKPCPYTPTQGPTSTGNTQRPPLRPTPATLGLNLTHKSSLTAYLQTLELHSPKPPSERAAFPLPPGPKPRTHPTLECHPA